jgi:hypothetical protein
LEYGYGAHRYTKTITEAESNFARSLFGDPNAELAVAQCCNRA